MCAPAFVLALAACAYAQDEAAMKLGKQVFQELAGPPCGLCHTLKDAEAKADIGPSLDELKADTARVEKAVKNGIGVMPAFPNLTDEQVKAVSTYVASVAGK
jgi:mono/diheme cytochrome c family protein